MKSEKYRTVWYGSTVRTVWQFRYLVVGEFERDRVEVPDDDGAVLATSGQQLTVRRPLHNSNTSFYVQYIRYRRVFHNIILFHLAKK